MTYHRRRGVAIIDTPKGVMVVAGRSRKYILPGGGTKKYESRRRAAIRELREETGLRAKKSTFLFSAYGKKWRGHGGKYIRNRTKVFKVSAYGRLRPRSEVKHIRYYKPGSRLNVTSGTREIVEKYYNKKWYTT